MSLIYFLINLPVHKVCLVTTISELIKFWHTLLWFQLQKVSCLLKINLWQTRWPFSHQFRTRGCWTFLHKWSLYLHWWDILLKYLAMGQNAGRSWFMPFSKKWIEHKMLDFLNYSMVRKSCHPLPKNNENNRTIQNRYTGFILFSFVDAVAHW